MGMSKDEFRETMRAAKAEEEINEIMKEIENPVEDPEYFPEEKSAEIEEDLHKTAITDKEQHKSDSESEPVAAAPIRKKPGPKPGRRKKKLTMPQETAEHMDKKVRQKEALNAMISLTKDHTQHIIMDSQRHIEIADKLADQASIYSGYVGTVEEMLNDYSSGF